MPIMLNFLALHLGVAECSAQSIVPAPPPANESLRPALPSSPGAGNAADGKRASSATNAAAGSGRAGKTTVKKDPYAQEKSRQLQPAQIGADPVVTLKPQPEQIPYQSQEDKQQEHLLPLSRPSFKALISVDRRLDPFGL